MARTYTTTLSLSLGGDAPTWEGEAHINFTVSFGRPEVPPAYGHGGLPADPDEIDDVTVVSIDGRTPEPEHADAIAEHIMCSDALLSHLLEHAREEAVEEAYAAADARYEARRDDPLMEGR